MRRRTSTGGLSPREIAVSREICSLERGLLARCHELGEFPGSTIEPEIYYGASGDPVKFVEIRGGGTTSLRVGLERTSTPRDPTWTCAWTIFVEGRSTSEGIFSAREIYRLAPQLTHALETYLEIARRAR